MQCLACAKGGYHFEPWAQVTATVVLPIFAYEQGALCLSVL